MNTLLADLSDWHHIYQFSREIIDPNTYAKFYLSPGTGYWILTRGGYLILSYGYIYPAVGTTLLVPCLVLTLLKRSGRDVIRTTSRTLFNVSCYAIQVTKRIWYFSRTSK